MMRFAQKLACVIVLVLAAAFSFGGSVLLYGNFADARQSTARQNKAQHALACYSLESAILARHSRGDGVDDAFLAQQVSGTHVAVGKHAAYAAVYRASVSVQSPEIQQATSQTIETHGDALFSALPAELASAAQVLPAGSMRYLKQNGIVYALYKTQLLEQTVLLSAFDVSEIYAVRARSVQRFLWMEGAVLLCAMATAILLARWLTQPLLTLAVASADIAGGAYEKRTCIATQDEIGALSVSFDAMAQSVEQTVHALECSVQQRDDFMGAFTHELKTPMTAIIGYADTLRTMQCDPDTQKIAADYIFGEAKRVETLSQKLLQLLQLAETPVQLMPIALQAVWQRVQVASAPWYGGVAVSFPTCARQAALQSYEEVRGLTAQVPVVMAETASQKRPKEHQGAMVLADADLLVDLLYNLLHNAVKACGQTGSVQITSEIRETCVHIAVRDNGAGIPAHLLERVTQPFFMVDKSRARCNGGSGIGLSLCSKIAELHGTKLVIESVVGKGTVISFELLLAAQDEQSAQTTQCAQKLQAAQAKQTKQAASPTQATQEKKGEQQ